MLRQVFGIVLSSTLRSHSGQIRKIQEQNEQLGQMSRYFQAKKTGESEETAYQDICGDDICGEDNFGCLAEGNHSDNKAEEGSDTERGTR